MSLRTPTPILVHTASLYSPESIQTVEETTGRKVVWRNNQALLVSKEELEAEAKKDDLPLPRSI